MINVNGYTHGPHEGTGGDTVYVAVTLPREQWEAVEGDSISPSARTKYVAVGNLFLFLDLEPGSVPA